MDSHKVNGNAEAETSHIDDLDTETVTQEDSEGNNRVAATVATVAVVGVGAAVIEAALVPGIVVGVAAMLLPKYFPRLGAALNPLMKSTVRGAYKLSRKTREMMAEAHEQVHDIVAEVHAEDELDAAEVNEPAVAGARH